MSRAHLHLHERRGEVSKLALFAITSIVVTIALGYSAILIRPDARQPSDTTAHRQPRLRIYCSASVVKPVSEVVEAYNRLNSAKIEIVRIGGSGELAGQLALESNSNMRVRADIFISADSQLLDNAIEEGIVSHRLPLAYQVPVIAVPGRSKLQIEDLSGLVKNPQIKFAVASEQAAIGKLTRDIARQLNIAEQLENRKLTETENVMMLGQALVVGSIDAAVVWDTTVNQINQALTSPEVPIKQIALADPQNKQRAAIEVGIVARGRSEEALRFARFLSSMEHGRPVFERFGFNFIEEASATPDSDR